MKNLLRAAVVLLISIETSAQHLVIKNGVSVSANNIIVVKGDFVNNGKFLQKTDPLILNGNYQEISGSSVSSFKNLHLKADSVKLNTALLITDSLHLIKGKLKLNDHLLKLDGYIKGAGLIQGSSRSDVIVEGNGDVGTIHFDTMANGFSNALRKLNISRNNNGHVILGNKLFIKEELNPAKGKITSNGLLTICSEDTLTASVANASEFNFIGDVNVERHIPAKAERKWLFVASAVKDVTVKNGWQDEIFITGPGTGGTVCHTSHTNGFDASGANSPSMYIYDQTNAVKWQSITGTNNTNLQAGKGYRLLVRGDRNTQNACADQLTSSNPPSPSSVTLVASGTLTKGDVSVTVHGGSKGYTLLGNPYASDIDFSALQAANSSIISNKYWTYDPASSSTNYLTYSNGTVTGCPSNIVKGANETQSGNANIIASGQAFFVESLLTTHSTITFKETYKTSAKQQGVFRANPWKNRIRLVLKKGNGVYVDDIVIRFSNDSAATVHENMYDAITLNSGNFIASMKGTRSYSIQTRPQTFTNDTVKLRIAVSAVGNYKLSFAEYENLSALSEVYLLDMFNGVTVNVTDQPEYLFSVTNDAASQGTGRFQLYFKKKVVLPLVWISIIAEKTANTVSLNWQVANASNIVKYEVWKSINGNNFFYLGTVQPGLATSYQFIDYSATGASKYFINAIQQNGGVVTSPVVGVKDAPTHFVIYPNPVQNKLFVQLPFAEKATLSVLNSSGTQFMQDDFKGNELRKELNVSHLASGVYFIVITTESKKTMREKFVKM